jgi:alpha-beta hydrolase superfamily lysophospholipase
MGARLRKFLGRSLLALGAGAAALWAAGPYEPVDLDASFEPRRFGEGVGVYFETVESRYSDITPGTEKRVIWAGQREVRTPLSVVYLHGFSATSEEIRPVPDRVAEALGANLVYTRLRGHGRAGAAMAEATAGDWMQDAAEALAAARHVGGKVIVIANSTGATLAAAAALDAELSRDVAAMVLMSPNFGVSNLLEPLLTWPAARYWLPPLAGTERVFPPRNAQHEEFWTTRYPSAAVLPMAALVKEVRGMNFKRADVPVLFWYSPADTVVRPERTTLVAEAWGGPKAVELVTPGPGDDIQSHVLAGDVLSPGLTEQTVAGILDWLKTLEIE